MRLPVEPRRDERGYSLIEILLGVTLLGIVMVPLSISMVVGWKTVFGIQQKLSSTADAQLLGATFPADVQSAGATGVNPTDPVNENTCAARAEAGETPLIMFVWDEDLGVSNQSVARYIAKGSGPDSQIIRRFCPGTSSSEDVVVARNFGRPGLQQASLFTLGPDGKTSPQCTATKCFIKITGEYNFELDVDRRVPGTAPGAFTPDAPTNVHALGGNTRATVYWTEPADNGGPLSGYLIEQTPGGAVLGPFSSSTTSGTTGVQINGLTNGQSYTFRVLAQNVLGPGPYSAPSGPVTPGPSTPDPPTIGVATPHPTSTGQATINWSVPTGYNDGGSALVGFKVYAQNAPDSPIVVPVDDPVATSLAVTGLSNNTKYGFRVSARNAYGEGSPSPSSLEALTLPGAPGTPTAAFTGTSGAVDVTFPLPTGGDFTSLTNFRARIIETGTYTTPVAAATACPGATPTTCTLTVTGIGSSQSYSIKVQAQNATGWGPESGAVTNVDLTAPVVTLDTPDQTFLNSGTPTIGGTAGTAAGDLPTITVKIYSGAVATGSPVQTRTATATSGAWSLAPSPALTSGPYTVVATQIDSTGNIGISNSRTFTVDTVAPSGSITAPASNAWVTGSVTVASNSWDALSGVASADFQYSPGGANAWVTIHADTSSPYGTGWDSTFLTEGEYDLRVITTDQAGNQFTSPVRTVRVDHTAPVIGAPNISGTLGSNGWYTSNVAVTWAAATDAASGIASTSGCGTTNIISNTAGQVVTCSATDNAGNTASDSVTIKRDASGPTGATLSSLGGAIRNGEILTGSGADSPSGVASITYLYCAGTSCTPTTTIGSSSTGSTYPVTWNGMPADGSYQILARAFDNAGNAANSAKQTIAIDNTIPSSATLDNPGAYVSNGQVLTGSGVDAGSGIASITYRYCAGTNCTPNTTIGSSSTPSSYAVTWNGMPADGSYQILARVFDNAGNSRDSAKQTIAIDNTIPSSATLDNPGAYVSNGQVLTGTGVDAGSGVASITYRYCAGTNCTPNTTIGSSSTASSYAVTWNGMPADGSYQILARVFDNAGNSRDSAKQTVTIDNTIPSSATLDNPGAYVSNGQVLTGTGVDAGSGVASITYRYCAGTNCTPNTTIGSSSTGSTYPVTWNSMPADGSYQILARVFDNAGNSRDSAKRTVTIDNTIPSSATLDNPGAYVSNGQVLTGTGVDAGSGVASITYRYCAGTNCTPNTTIGSSSTASSYAVTWNGMPADGSYQVLARVFDEAGNSRDSAKRTVTIDNTIPTSATLAALPSVMSNGDVLTGSGVDAGSGIGSITYRYCAGTNCTPTTTIGSSSTGSTYPVTWNSMPADGSYQILARVFDNAGNSRDSAKQTITIDNTAPVKTSMDMRDNDGDGKIDRVVVTFNEPLAASTSTAPWTLTNVPSGGTKSSVTVSGSTATVIITEGTGEKDTAVGTFKVALAASATGIRDAMGNQASFAATAPSDDAAPVPDSPPASPSQPIGVRLNGKTGNSLGKAEAGDFVTLSFSEPMAVSSLCTTWSNNNNNQSIGTVTVTLTNSGTSDYLTFGTPCANIGKMDTNANYVTTTRTFTNSTVAWNVASQMLTITLGTASGAVESGVATTVPEYTPTTSLKDPAGNTMTATPYSGTSSRF